MLLEESWFSLLTGDSSATEDPAFQRVSWATGEHSSNRSGKADGSGTPAYLLRSVKEDWHDVLGNVGTLLGLS